MIAIVDYGMGNLRSIQNAFDYIGIDVIVTRDENELLSADGVVLPGVGAFPDAMKSIHETGLLAVLNTIANEHKKPVLGICLGMQLFAKSSSEHGDCIGLGWLNSDVRKLNVPGGLKVPHVGWNNITYPAEHWLFQGLPKHEANFYFVHSFEMLCHEDSELLATVDYGKPVTAIACRENLLAIQFHPEKSQDNGLQVLQNWAEHYSLC